MTHSSAVRRPDGRPRRAWTGKMARIPEFNFSFNRDLGFLKPIPWPKLKKKIDRLISRTEKLAARVESDKLRSQAKAQKEELTATNNCKCIPSNATISNEYVKCGKSGCSESKHGPYFYAYWKDDHGRLMKKYIGKYRLLLGNSNNDNRPKDSEGVK
jgi:hypothetical protein